MNLKIKVYEYEDVKDILDNPDKSEEIARRLKRTTGALRNVRSLADLWQEGKARTVSKVLQGHFTRYFANKGNMQLEEIKQPQEATQLTEDACKEQLERIINEAGETFNLLQNQMAEIAKLRVAHGNHSVLDELKDLREWKKKVEPELADLKVFREKAKKSNFGSMLRNMSSF